MSLTESVDGWLVNATTKANDTLTSNQWRNATFPASTPAGYSKAWQNITVTGLTATPDVRAVQYASVPAHGTDFLEANDTGSGYYAQLAMRFLSVDRANLTGIWMYYTSAGVANLDIVNSSVNSGDTTPSGRPTIATYSLPTAVQGWHFVKFNAPLALRAGFYYWVVVNATGMGITLVNWYYIADPGTVQDNKYAAAYISTTSTWYNEVGLYPALSKYINFMLMVVVLPVSPLNVKQTRTYSSPAQVGMELNGTLPITANRTSIPVSYNTLVLNANTSVEFVANWTARFVYSQLNAVSTKYVAKSGFTLWNATFSIGNEPSPTTYPYTWYNLTFMVTTIPQYWSVSNPAQNVTNTQQYTQFAFLSGLGYYLVNDTKDIAKAWSNQWTIASKSSYKISPSLPSQVVAGLPLTVTVSTAPYSASWCNVSFYTYPIGSRVYTKNATFSSASNQLTLKLNDTGIHTLFLFDRWTGGDEASLNKTLQVNVLQPACNVTITGRMSPVLGNNGALKFKFYNNSLGTGNTKMQPLAVSVNGTLTTNYVYDSPSGNTTLSISTASGVWRVGNNTINVSAQSGVFNATLKTWIMVLPQLCNITVVGRTSAVIGNNVALKFKFYNNSVGSGVAMQPSTVSVNGTLTSFTNGPGGNTSVTLGTTSAGWHVGNNTLDVSAQKGNFNATLRTWIWVQTPLCHISGLTSSQPPPRTNMTINFQFANDTPGATQPISPTLVMINGTSVSFTNSAGVVTTTWSILRGGWHVGPNHVNVSVTSGFFTNYTVGVINIVSPPCNVTVESINSPILGDYAVAQFKFLNLTSGLTPMNMTDIEVNGTAPNLDYAGGQVWTVSWLTSPYDGWQPGRWNHANITAFNNVYFNFTVVSFWIIAPKAQLTLNSTSYAAVYGDNAFVGFTFMNTTGSAPQPFPTAIDLYVNGSLTTPTMDFLNGSYAYVFDTRYLSQAGSFVLNLTAVYETYTNSSLVSIVVSKITLTFTLSLGESSVTAGSSLSASATLRYANNTPVQDLTPVIFEFTVTYTNGTVKSFNVTSVTAGGSCSASFVTSGDMKKIDVEAIYQGDGIRNAATKSAPSVQVTPPTSGFSVMTLLVTTAGGALAVIVVAAVAITRRRGKEKEFKKTAVLRQTASLAQLLVVHLASGRCLFSRTIGSEEGADPNLISGFLSANQTLINEVFKRQTGAGLKFADYGEYKVISDVGKYVMATLFATETAGEELKDSLRKFTLDFEKKYCKTLESWDGDMKAFDRADEIADDVFCLPLTAPYMLLEDESVRLGKEERLAVHSAKIISAERGVFFMPRVIDYLLTKQGVKRAKAMDVINSLTKKGIFRQLTVEQASQVVKSWTEKASAQS
jgi:hypothetical protein